MKRIWFNHWFSTVYNMIELIKKGEGDFYIIGSNEGKSVVSCVCDEFYIEPVLKGKDYIDFCLDFCKEHKVDIFCPHRGMVDISKNKSLFEEIGVKVLIDDYDIVSILEDKDKTYKLLKDKGFDCIPEYIVVNSVDEFLSAYNDLSKKYDKLCCKKIVDIGALSFKVIDSEEKLHNIVEGFKKKTKFAPTMIMPYLRGVEVSVDCLKTDKGNIIVPRQKEYKRVQRVSFNEEIINICNKVLDSIDLNTPCNMQFIYDEGKPYFLEVNTRMSGGTYLSCLGANVNIPNIAINKILEVSLDWDLDKSDKCVSYIESAIIVK